MARSHCIFPLLFLIGTLFVYTCFSFVPLCWSQDTQSTATFSLNVQNETLDTVCAKISSATGYVIAVNDNCSQLPVTVKVHDAAVLDGLRQVLRSYDFGLIENKESRTVNVLVFCKEKSKGDRSRRIGSADIDEYAEKYIEPIKKNRPELILAQNIDDHAQEYKRRVEKKNPQPIQADNINDYAEQYISRTEDNNPKPEPIQADSIDEYAEKYLRRTKKK